jgi:hypothetical protein
MVKFILQIDLDKKEIHVLKSGSFYHIIQRPTGGRCFSPIGPLYRKSSERCGMKYSVNFNT